MSFSREAPLSLLCHFKCFFKMTYCFKKIEVVNILVSFVLKKE